MNGWFAKGRAEGSRGVKNLKRSAVGRGEHDRRTDAVEELGHIDDQHRRHAERARDRQQRMTDVFAVAGHRQLGGQVFDDLERSHGFACRSLFTGSPTSSS
jgi:hypothetical protein